MENFTILCSAEIEFYIITNHIISSQNSNSTVNHDILFHDIERNLNAAGIRSFNISEEDGNNQYEISFENLYYPKELIEIINLTKKVIIDSAAKHDIAVNFTAKPFLEQSGNALHINLSLHNNSGHNLFKKINPNQETLLLLYSIGGLMKKMLDSMPYFAPDNNSYQRIKYPHNSPTNVSWSSNNRTVALRVPTSTHNPNSRHIEHRVPSASADPEAAITAIVEAVEYGIKDKILPSSDKIFGNAQDIQYKRSPYNLVDLPTSR
ncbi:MAG: glutamine synthetase [Pseudomonadota bacterium]